MTIKTIYIDGADKDLSMMNQGILKQKRGRKPKEKLDSISECNSLLHNNNISKKSQSQSNDKKSEIMSIVEKYRSKDSISCGLSKINTKKENDEMEREKQREFEIERDREKAEKMRGQIRNNLLYENMSLKSLSQNKNSDNKSLVKNFFNKKINGEKSNISTINSFFKNRLDKLDVISEKNTDDNDNISYLQSRINEKDTDKEGERERERERERENTSIRNREIDSYRDRERDSQNEKISYRESDIESIKINIDDQKEKERDILLKNQELERLKEKEKEMEIIEKMKQELQKEKEQIQREREEIQNEKNIRLLKEKEFYDNQEKLKNEKIRLVEEQEKIENERKNIKEMEKREKENINKQKKTLCKYRDQIKKIISKKNINKNNHTQKKDTDNKNKNKKETKNNNENKKDKQDKKNDDVSSFNDIIKNITIFNDNNLDNYYTKNISLSINDLRCPMKNQKKKNIDKENMKKILYKNKIIKHLDTPDHIINHIYNMTDDKLLK